MDNKKREQEGWGRGDKRGREVGERGEPRIGRPLRRRLGKHQQNNRIYSAAADAGLCLQPCTQLKHLANIGLELHYQLLFTTRVV